MRQLATRSPVLGTVVELRLDGTPAATSLAEDVAWETIKGLEHWHRVSGGGTADQAEQRGSGNALQQGSAGYVGKP